MRIDIHASLIYKLLYNPEVNINSELINIFTKRLRDSGFIDKSLLAKIERNERTPNRQLIKQFAAFFNVNEKVLINEFLSDQIVYKILNEESDLNILKVAEEKIKYIKSQNG